MANMLLEDFLSVLGDPIYVLAIIFASVGIACALLAKKITRLVRKTETVKPDDKVLLGMKIAGLALILVGFVLLMIGGFTRL